MSARRRHDRRALLSGASAVGAVAAGAAAIAPAAAVDARSSDAELLALCAAWHRAEDRYQAAWTALETAMGHATDGAVRMARKAAADPDGRLFAEVCAAEEAEAGLRDRIGATRAATLAGVVAKARIAERMYGRSSDINSFAGQLADATLGLLPDLAALGGEAA